MANQRRFEFLPEWGRWWRSLVHNEKLRVALFLFFGALVAIALMAVVIKIVQEWDTRTVVDTVVGEVARRPGFLILIGLAALFFAVVALLWIVGVLWAWIMLPFTLREGVAAVNRLRLEVRRLRRRMFPAPGAHDDADFDDLDG
jgi:hypothetical protein